MSLAQLRPKARSKFDSLSRDSLVPVTTRKIKGILSGANWVLSRRTGPPPSAFKRRLIRRVGVQFGLDTVVETGTFLGDTVAAIRPHFERIISIELSGELAGAAMARFATAPDVTILEGDSAKILPLVLPTLDGPALFWLDGHWSGGVTARGDVASPIVEELEAVLADRHEHVVLIDDARCFVGSDGYPTLESLRELVARLRPHASVDVRFDVVSVLP